VRHYGWPTATGTGWPRSASFTPHGARSRAVAPPPGRGGRSRPAGQRGGRPAAERREHNPRLVAILALAGPVRLLQTLAGPIARPADEDGPATCAHAVHWGLAITTATHPGCTQPDVRL
jgi:hypothetical protein